MKIICVGRNYAEHAKELNNTVPEQPVIFLKPQSAMVRPKFPVHYPEFTDNLQYECEVVIRICRNGKQIPQKAARQYFDHWTVGIDFTARDVQNRLKAKGLPWEIAKSFDNSAVVGDWVALAPDEPLGNATFSLNVNGTQAQEGKTSDMIHSFEKIVSYVSKFFTLQIGDVIFTGTPAGVGPVLPYDRLEGFLNDKKLLDVEVR
jgi:acylpyruvate hydrolase